MDEPAGFPRSGHAGRRRIEEGHIQSPVEQTEIGRDASGDAACGTTRPVQWCQEQFECPLQWHGYVGANVSSRCGPAVGGRSDSDPRVVGSIGCVGAATNRDPGVDEAGTRPQVVSVSHFDIVEESVAASWQETSWGPR